MVYSFLEWAQYLSKPSRPNKHTHRNQLPQLHIHRKRRRVHTIQLRICLQRNHSHIEEQSAQVHNNQIVNHEHVPSFSPVLRDFGLETLRTDRSIHYRLLSPFPNHPSAVPALRSVPAEPLVQDKRLGQVPLPLLLNPLRNDLSQVSTPVWVP